AGGDEAEEDEDEEIAEPVVAERPGAAGVEPAGGDREDADGDDRPAADRREREAEGHRDAERDPRRALDRRRLDQPALRHPPGTDPLGVGAPLEVRVVVGEVGADLDEERAETHSHAAAPETL